MTMVVFNLSASEKLLCDVLADGHPSKRIKAAKRLWDRLGDGWVFALAQANQISPIIAHALMDALGPQNVPYHWRHAHNITFMRISSFMEEMDHFASELTLKGVKVVVIENAALAKKGHYCLGCFNFGDLDFIFQPEDGPVISEVLCSLGYSLESSNDGRLEYKGKCGQDITLRINLQPCLVSRRWFSSDREPEVGTLINRAVRLNSSSIYTLNTEDFLFQLITHNASHGYVRKPGINLHLDIHRFLQKEDVVWDDFIEMTCRYRVTNIAYWSLAIPKALFNTSVPNNVLKLLRPSAWKEKLISRWLQKAGLFNPDEKKFSRIGYIFFAALLYDDLSGLWRGIFPGWKWMREHYKFRNNFFLPYYYVRRLKDLVLRRVST